MQIRKEQDIEFMKNIAKKLFMNLVLENYGEDGIDSLNQVISVLSNIYKYIKLDDKKNILVYKTSNSKYKLSTFSSKIIKITDFSTFASKPSDIFTVEVINQNEVFVLFDEVIPSKDIVLEALVYEFKKDKEIIYDKKANFIDIETPPDMLSYFHFPTYTELEYALEDYKNIRALRSNCPYLQNAWFSENCILFSPRPEEKMRKSLYDFLSAHLRAEVREEQNVNDSEPVDIKITWSFSNHIALIEIKWLGKSIASIGQAKFNQTYSEGRAREGAKQLADYLNENLRYTPRNVTVGYLVVFDGRRWQTKTDSDEIDRTNGFYYQNQEIVYDPKYHEIRGDFATPVRFFMEPVITN